MTARALLALLSLVLLTAAAPVPASMRLISVLWSSLGAGYIGRSGPAPLAGSAPEWLPAGRAACTSLGLNADAPDGCTLAALLDAAAQRTDPALWFGKVLSIVGPALEDCSEAIAIQSYRTVAGTDGTTYLCRVQASDDQITDTAVTALRARAAQLNQADPMTFADHQAADGIKLMIRTAIEAR